MKRRMTKKKNTIMSHFPGEYLQRKIQTDTPLISGTYLCFIKPDPPEAWNHFPICRMGLIDFKEDQWQESKIILGWIGPLPVLSLDELEDFSPRDSGLILYFIGYMDDSELFIFEKGPFYQSIDAKFQEGEAGQFIYQVNSRTAKSVPISEWKDGNWYPVNEERTYTVCTLKEMINREYKEQSLGSALKTESKKGYYIFEINKESITPIHQWNSGWAALSGNKTRKIKERIGVVC